jgi:hypothetical protein
MPLLRKRLSLTVRRCNISRRTSYLKLTMRKKTRMRMVRSVRQTVPAPGVVDFKIKAENSQIQLQHNYRHNTSKQRVTQRNLKER